MRWAGRAIVALAALVLVSQLFLRDGGVGFVTGLVVFLIGWWTVLFTVLPRDITGQHETGEIVAGSEPGAPADPQLARKAWLTTVITAAIWLVFFVIVEFSLIPLGDFLLAPR